MIQTPYKKSNPFPLTFFVIFFFFLLSFFGLENTCLADTPSVNYQIGTCLRFGSAYSTSFDQDYYYAEFIVPSDCRFPWSAQLIPFKMYHEPVISYKNNFTLLAIGTSGVLYLLSTGYKANWLSKDFCEIIEEGIKVCLAGFVLNMWTSHYTRVPLDLKNQNLALSYGINMDYIGIKDQYWVEVETGLVFNNLIELSAYHHFGFNHSGIKVGTSVLF